MPSGPSARDPVPYGCPGGGAGWERTGSLIPARRPRSPARRGNGSADSKCDDSGRGIGAEGRKQRGRARRRAGTPYRASYDCDPAGPGDRFRQEWTEPGGPDLWGFVLLAEGLDSHDFEWPTPAAEFMWRAERQASQPCRGTVFMRHSCRPATARRTWIRPGRVRRLRAGRWANTSAAAASSVPRSRPTGPVASKPRVHQCWPLVRTSVSSTSHCGCWPSPGRAPRSARRPVRTG